MMLPCGAGPSLPPRPQPDSEVSKIKATGIIGRTNDDGFTGGASGDWARALRAGLRSASAAERRDGAGVPFSRLFRAEFVQAGLTGDQPVGWQAALPDRRGCRGLRTELQTVALSKRGMT